MCTTMCTTPIWPFESILIHFRSTAVLPKCFVILVCCFVSGSHIISTLGPLTPQQTNCMKVKVNDPTSLRKEAINIENKHVNCAIINPLWLYITYQYCSFLSFNSSLLLWIARGSVSSNTKQAATKEKKKHTRYNMPKKLTCNFNGCRQHR